MKRIKFESYPGVTAGRTTNPLTIRLEGDRKSLDSIKKKLTIKNKAIRWDIERLVDQINFLSSRAQYFDETSEDYLQYMSLISQKEQEISELEPKEITELYEESVDSLEVPAGFWWFAGNKNGVNINTELQPYYADGLRDYQQQALVELYKYRRAGLCLATGLGKSKIISSICKAAENSGLRACVVVPTDYLVGQMTETIKELTESVAAMGGGRKTKLGQNVMVTTAQSAMKVIDDYDVIIIDEGHHAPASTWVDLLSTERASHVYLLTATPYRSDGQDMAIHAFTGPIVFERDARWGIANGWLKPAKVYLKTVDYFDDDGNSKYLHDKTNSQRAYKILTGQKAALVEVRDTLKKMIDNGRRVIVLYKTIKAGQALKKFCKGIVDFDVADAKYKKPINDFRDGKTNILVGNDRLLSEGIDIPSANALIMVTQNSSPIVTSQAFGRILRPSPGFGLVIDITLNGYSKFIRAKKARAKIYKAVTDDVFDVGEKK
jgi:superfamily II DNA or RNA helicase